MSGKPTGNTAKVVQPSMRELFEPAKLQLDRAPVLRGVFERFAGVCSERFKSLCVPPSTFMLNAVTSGGLWDLIEEYEDGLCGVYHSIEWDTRILIGVDQRFAFSFTEAIFGGDGTEAPLESDRQFSSIELRVLKEVFALASGELETLLGIIDNVTLSFERIETKLDFSTIGLPDAPAIMTQLIAQVHDGGGRIFVIIPQSALIPLRRKLERERSPEVGQHDPVWGRRLMTEIGMADVRLDAILPGPTMTMHEIASMRVGEIIQLPGTIESPLVFESAGEQLFRGRLAQSSGQFSIQIVDRANQRQELIDHIVACSALGHGGEEG